MTSPVRIALKAVSVSLTMNSMAQAQSESGLAAPEEFTTATGETLVLPPIAEMECDDMEKVLGHIDSTGYRENAPVPHDKADKPLFEYELALAEENYHRCVVRREKTFSSGFFVLRGLRKQGVK